MTVARTLIPLDDLVISPLNTRHDLDPDALDHLVQSIATIGLIQPLAVFAPEDGHPDAGVVAGGRRLRALQVLAQRGAWSDLVPVLVTQKRTQAQAWALAENTVRAALSPADEVTAFAAARARGAMPRDVALAYGVTEHQVAQRLRLARVIPAALDALRAREITLDQMTALTLTQDSAAQAALLDLARQEWSPAQLRHKARADRPSTSDKRVKVVGLTAYEAAGGEVTRDLFGDMVLIEDVDLLDRLFSETVARITQAYRDMGWKWATFCPGDRWSMERQMESVRPVTDDPDDPIDARYPADLRARAGVLFEFDWNGQLQATDDRYALIAPEDRVSQTGSNTSADDGDTPPPEDDGPAFPAAVLADLRAIELAAVQAKLMFDDAALQWLASIVFSGQAGATQQVMGVSLRPCRNAPSITDGFSPPLAAREMLDCDPQGHARAVDLDALWQANPPGMLDTNYMLRLAFARLILWGGVGDPDAPRQATPFWSTLVARLDARLRDVWTPTEAFFFRLRSPALDRIHADLFNLTAADSHHAAFCRLRKGEKAARLHGLFHDPRLQKLHPHWNDAAAARIATWEPHVHQSQPSSTKAP